MSCYRLLALVFLFVAFSPSFADCDSSLGSGNTPPANSITNCTGPGFSNTLWTGMNNLTINVTGTINASNLNELIRVDTYGNGNTGWTANNVIINNSAEITASRSTAFLQGILLGAGDQNNPTNGDLILNNSGTLDYTNTQKFGAIYLIRHWSPNGLAQINNTGEILGRSPWYPVLIYQVQRGEINNQGDIKAAGRYPYGIIQTGGTTGWVGGSGYSPNYLASEFISERLFEINNSGEISVDVEAGGYGIAVYTDYAQGSTINNSGTIDASTDASTSAWTLYYNSSYQNPRGGVRQPIEPYIINNEGTISYTGTNPNSYAIYVDGKDFDGTPKPYADPNAFNPQMLIDNEGTIQGNITLADADDNITLNTNSSTESTILMAGGKDTMTIAAVNTLISGELNGGGNSVIGDETSWDDTLNFAGFVGAAPTTNNWEYINVNSGSSVSLKDATNAGQVTTNDNGELVLPNTQNLTAAIVNNGSLTMADGVLGSFAINGDLSGAGRLDIDVDIINGSADVLTVNGSTTGSTIQINPNNISNSILAGDHEIEIVRVTGTTAEGDFTLLGGGLTYEPSGIGVTYRLELRGQRWYLMTSPRALAIPVNNLGALLLLLLGLFGFSRCYSGYQRNCV